MAFVAFAIVSECPGEVAGVTSIHARGLCSAVLVAPEQLMFYGGTTRPNSFHSTTTPRPHLVARFPASPSMAPLEVDAIVDDTATGDTFRLLSQQLELDISFCPREIKGKTTLDIQPETAFLREIRLNARQLRPTNIHIEGQKAGFNYSNLHQRLTLYPGTGLEQYHYIKDRIKRHTQDLEDELVVFVPDNVKIRQVKPEEVGLPADAPGTFYAPLKLEIDYVLDDFRDAFHFVGVEDGDPRLPHAYTRNSPFPGTASCLFPCIDDGETRCTFEVSVRYPRTMGEALAREPTAKAQIQANGHGDNDSAMAEEDDDMVDLSEEEKATEMQVICSGTLTDDVCQINLIL